MHERVRAFRIYGIQLIFNPHSCPTSLWSIFWKEKQFQNTTTNPFKMNPFTIWPNQNEQVIEQVNEQLYIYIIKKQTVKNNLNNIKIDIEKNLINQPVQIWIPHPKRKK
jgi:hypothetical protein